MNPGPWCYIGDFNSVLGAHEKRGGRLPTQASYDVFKAWSDSCNLTHIMTRGAAYTWSKNRSLNGHIEMRLDRAMCIDDWLNFWDNVACCTLTRSHSDHYPLLLVLKKGVVTFLFSFKFQGMWCYHSDCRRFVADT